MTRILAGETAKTEVAGSVGLAGVGLAFLEPRANWMLLSEFEHNASVQMHYIQ